CFTERAIAAFDRDIRMELVAAEDPVRGVLVIARTTAGAVGSLRLADGCAGIETQVSVAALGLCHGERGKRGETCEQRGSKSLLLDEHGGFLQGFAILRICDIARKG